MQRTIKFRAWRFANADFDWDARMIYDDEEMGSPGYHIGHFGAFEDKRYIFMQFTGLLDKNRKEIYEGDIVRVIGSGVQILATVSQADNGYAPFNDRCYPVSDWRLWEVIGNIHENPDLLK